MSESKSGPRWVALLAGGTAVAVGAWLLLGDSGGPQHDPADSAARKAPTTGSVPPPTPAEVAVDPADGSLRIQANGRLTIDEASLPEEGPLLLVLDLADDLRGSGERTVRVVSVDGRRLDTTATSRPGAGSGLQLDLDPSFLTRGLYMIEVDTEGGHPLRIRRYVLELQ